MAGTGEKTILVVEDDPLCLKLVTDILELYGYAALACTDGPSTLLALKETKPSLILLDIGLPGMDGFEVFAKIRSDARLADVKIIALSASTMKEDEEKIWATGFDGFVAKPINLKNFVATLQKSLPS